MGRFALIQPLRHRDYRLLWIASVTSLFGDGIYTVALAWLVYDITNTATALSVVGMMVSIGLVTFLLVGGVVADRVDRRHQMIGADITRGLVVTVIGVLAVTGTAEIWMLAVLGLVYGVGDAFFNPASSAIIPQLLPAEAVVQANALSEVGRPLAFRLVGPALGGLLVGLFGAGTAMFIDAGTFLLGILLLSLIRPLPPLRTEHAHPLQDLKEGWAFLRAHAWLWATCLAAGIAVLATYAPLQVLLPYVVRNDLHDSASTYGLILTVGGLGGLVGGLVMSQVGMPRRALAVMFWVWAVGDAAFFIAAPATAPWHLMVLTITFSFAMAVGAVIWGTLIQTRVPQDMMGRVSSVDWLVSFGLAPVSFAITGPIADRFGVDATIYGAATVGSLCLVVVLYAVPGLASDSYETGDVVGEAGVADVGGVHADDLDALR